MRVCLVFDQRAWEEPAARFTIETVATLLETPWRSIVGGAEVRADEAQVFVGAPAMAPADAAAVVPVEGWPEWELDSLRTATFESEPLVCPRGELSPAIPKRELPIQWLRSIGFMLCRD